MMGVYEAYYNAKTAPQAEAVSEGASLYVQGEDYLCLNVWKADEASTEKKPVMVWIHGKNYPDAQNLEFMDQVIALKLVH